MRVSVFACLSLLFFSGVVTDADAQFRPSGRRKPPVSRTTQREQSPPRSVAHASDIERVIQEIRDRLDHGEASVASTLLEQSQRQVAPGSIESERLDDLAIEAARQQGKLPELATSLERRPNRTVHQALELAELQIELGQNAIALATLRRARQHPDWSLTSERRYCEILEFFGDSEKASRCYRRLVLAQPERLDVLSAELSRLTRRGKRREAFEILDEAEHQGTLSVERATAIANAWERLGESARAARVLEPIALRAQDRRTQGVHAQKPHWLEEAEMAVEGDAVERAISLVEQGLKTDKARTKDTLARVAAVYERAVVNSKTRNLRYFAGAEPLWFELLLSTDAPDALTNRAIEHLVRNWTLASVLEERAKSVELRLYESPRSVPLRRLLSRCERRLSRSDRARAVLAQGLGLLPDPTPLLRDLEQIAEDEGNYAEALTYAEALARLEAETPERLEKLVKYAEQATQMEKAQTYARRFAEAFPNHPNALSRLAHLAQLSDSPQIAIAYLARACAANPSRYELRLALALEQQTLGYAGPALSHALAILREDRDENRLESAFRLARPLAQELARNQELEQALYLAVTHVPQATSLRQHLQQHYAQQLAGRVNLEPYSPIAKRAAQLLLEDLASPRDDIKAGALRQLSIHPLADCAEALLQFAIAQKGSEFGTQAFVILGQLRDSALLLPLLAWFKSQKPHRLPSPYALAALYCLSRYDDARATAMLRDVLATGCTEAVAVAALSLALRHDHATLPRLSNRLKEPIAPLERAAILLARELLSPRITDTNQILDRTNDASLRVTQIALLARMNSDVARRGLAIRLCEAALSQGALAAAVPHDSRWLDDRAKSALYNPALFVAPHKLIAQVAGSEASGEQRRDVFGRLHHELGEACYPEIAINPELAKRLGRALFGEARTPNFDALFGPKSHELADEDPALQHATADWFYAVAPGFARYRDSQDLELRLIALGILAVGLRDVNTITAALADPNVQIRERAYLWSYATASTKLFEAIAHRLKIDDEPRLRVLAAERLGKADAGSLPEPVRTVLADRARRDPYPSVRIAALKALWRNNPVAASSELSYAEANDNDIEVRVTSHQLLTRPP